MNTGEVDPTKLSEEARKKSCFNTCVSEKFIYI